MIIKNHSKRICLSTANGGAQIYRIWEDDGSINIGREAKPTKTKTYLPRIPSDDCCDTDPGAAQPL